MAAITTYHSIFAKVQSKRLRFVNKLSILLAIAISITFSILTSRGVSDAKVVSGSSVGSVGGGSGSGGGGSAAPHFGARHPFLWNCILATFVYRGPILFASIFLVKQSREIDSTVSFTKHKTLASQAFHTVLSPRFLRVAVYYVLLASLVYLVSYIDMPVEIYSIAKEYRQKDFINDNLVVFLFNAAFIGVCYAFQHLTFQRNRLRLFKYGAGHLKPTLLNVFFPIPRLIAISAVISVFVTVVALPFVFYFLGARQLIYKLNWIPMFILGLDTRVHPTSFGSKWAIVLQSTWTSFHCVLSWEILNHLFNLYMSIGCLDGKKPISTYSSDPLNTLISGLRDYDHEFTRFTAFQELSYLSTVAATEDNFDIIKLRTSIFNAHSKYGNFYNTIFEECSLVIRETCLRVNYRSESDLEKLQQTQHAYPLLSTVDAASPVASLTASTSIFGNSNLNKSEKLEEMKKFDKPNSSTISKSVPFKTGVPSVDKYVELGNTYLNTFLNILNQYSSTTVLPPIIKSIHSNYYAKFQIFKDEFLSTTIGVVFRITLNRDCESRVIDPIIFGNAIISISNLLCRAIEEDKKGTIQNHQIADVLTLLERPIRAMNNYTESLPQSIDLSLRQRQNPKLIHRHLIALLHDLSIKEFFDICIKYNSKLNDLVLSARVFKLAKRVIDAAIAQRSRPQRY